MRRMLNMRRRRLATAEPEHLAGLLAKEKPVVAEAVLRVLPSSLAHSVQAALPGFRGTPARKEPRAEVFSIVRWKLEEELRNFSASALFQFEDLMGLQARELITLCDRMGARVFATTWAALPSGERQSFFEALPPDQRMLAQKANEAAQARQLKAMQAGDARRLLELHGASQAPASTLRSAGARRIMRACLAQSAEFASKMAQRHEGELGALLSRWFKEEKGTQIRGDGGRADILEQLEFLAKRGFLERPLMLAKPKVVPVAQSAQAPARAASTSGASSARLVPSAMKSSQSLPERLPRPTLSKLMGPGGMRGNVAELSRATGNIHLLPKPHSTEASMASSSPRAAGVERTAASSPPKASGVERTAASSPPRAAGVERTAASSPPRAAGAERTAASSLPRAAAGAGRSSLSRVTGAERSVATFPPRAAGAEPLAKPPRPRAENAERTSASSLFAQDKSTDKAIVRRMSAQTPAPGAAPGGMGKGLVTRVPALQSVPKRRTAENAGATKREDNEETDHRHKSAKMKPGRTN